jgi:arylformamidase
MVHWPDDPEVEVERVADMAEGYGWNLSQISMSAHTGTHIDAPLHVVADGLAIDQMPLDAMIGPSRVIEITSRHAVEPDELRGQEIGAGDRILFKTINSQRGWTNSRFLEDYVGVSPAAAEFLAARGVQTVGIDYLSIGRYGQEGETTHRTLLRAGIWVIEGLDLAAVAAGAYDLVCLPLKLVGAEGAPARAILRKATA